MGNVNSGICDAKMHFAQWKTENCVKKCEFGHMELVFYTCPRFMAKAWA